LRVLVWPAGWEDDATSQYRLLMPARALAGEGADVVVDRTGPTVVWDREWHGTTPPADANVWSVYRPDADVVVLQRPGRRWWTDIIPHLQLRGVRVVVDVDDRFDLIPRRNVAAPGYRPRVGSTHSYEWIDRACRLADTVTCSTLALRDRYGYGHGMVLPNLVPERYLSVEPAEKRDAVGWAGSVDTHPGDLEVTEGALPRALHGTDWGVHVVGTGKGVRRALRLEAEPSVTGWVPFERYPGCVAEIGIGIVPLHDSPFNACKSALKAAEMASLGVPVVMSPTPDNRRLHGLGVGELADSPGQWRRWLSRLIRSAEARADLAGRGREAMAGQTYERLCGRWWQAWEGAPRTTKELVHAG